MAQKTNKMKPPYSIQIASGFVVLIELSELGLGKFWLCVWLVIFLISSLLSMWSEVRI